MTTHPINLLIVEDNPSDQAITIALLNRSELTIKEISHCTSAEEGYAMLLTQLFDCCLFDINLTGNSGLWLLEKYKQSEPSNTAMIALTESQDPTFAAQLMRDGAHGFIPKANISSQRLGEQILQGMSFHRAQSDLYLQASRDPLTTLLNRNSFSLQLARTLQRLAKNNDEGLLLFFDIDNFKPLNDQYGHATGDMLLREFAKKLTHYCRPQDILGRLGGDEFIAFMPSTKAREATSILDRLQHQIVINLHLETRALAVTTSIGISCFPEHGTEIPTLLKNADAALYSVKRHGKSSWEVYSSSVTTERNRAKTKRDLIPS